MVPKLYVNSLSPVVLHAVNDCHAVLRSVDLWIKGSVKSHAFLLRCDASSPLPSGASHGLFYPEIPPAQYMLCAVHLS